MNKYGKMTNEELLKKFESEAMTVYDYSTRTMGYKVKPTTIEEKKDEE